MLACRLCGVEVEKYTNGKRCRECYNSYMAQYMLKRYHQRREEALILLGGCCVICGSQENLEVDHIDENLKEYNIGKVWSYSKEKFLAELEKCQLLCSEHHQQKTTESQSVEHGGGISGKKNCYCDLCKPLKREYMRKWRIDNPLR